MVLTYNRHSMVYDLVSELQADMIETFVVDHDSTPPIYMNRAGVYVRYLPQWQGDEFNISKCWNYGLDWVHRHHEHSAHHDEDYAVAVLNDDVRLQPGWCHAMADAIQMRSVDVASPGPFLHIDKTPVGQVPLDLRPTGSHFMLRGYSGIRSDERMRVWYNDDDIWQQAKQGRGYALIPGFTAENLDPSGWFSRTGWWADQAGRDRETFVQKWGFQPW